MSTYTDYSATSTNYDRTREPVGVDLVLGSFALSGSAIDDLVVLDAGCGTGTYAEALGPHVRRLCLVDRNPGMLGEAAAKVGGRAILQQGEIDRLPLVDAAVDAAMVNQVLHHLDDARDRGWPRHRAVLTELARVVRPGGRLVINTTSQAQLADGYWYYRLIPGAVADLASRYPPLVELMALLGDVGFTDVTRVVPVDAVLQGDAYFDGLAPLDSEWRDGDSVWSLVDADELDMALATIEDLAARGELDAYVGEADARRPTVGQVTFVSATRA